MGCFLGEVWEVLLCLREEVGWSYLVLQGEVEFGEEDERAIISGVSFDDNRGAEEIVEEVWLSRVLSVSEGFGRRIVWAVTAAYECPEAVVVELEGLGELGCWTGGGRLLVL